jgi:hypothetical protein
MGLLSIVNPFAWIAWVKFGALAIVLVFASYKLGHWNGEGVGYSKRDREVMAQVISANAEIDKLHDALEDATALLNAGRDQAATDAANSLADLPAALRNECAVKCSMPNKARLSLEAIR